MRGYIIAVAILLVAAYVPFTVIRLRNPDRLSYTDAVIEAPVLPDPSSLSNAPDIRVISYHLSLAIDFAEQKLSGFITVVARAASDNVNHLVLDTKHLEIIGVEDAASGDVLHHELAALNPVLGSSLSITLPRLLMQGEQIQVQ